MTYVIAEIGFNHEGDLEAAKEMITQAAKAGADAVKFQSFKAEDIALPGSEHFEAIRTAELKPEMHRKLKTAADAANIDFLSTPFGIWAVDLLEELDIPAYKVASMDCANHVLLERIARTGKPIYLSTGMALLDEIRGSLEFLNKNNSGPVTALHCMAKYPPEADELNLETIPFLRRELGIPVGYSDHFPGIEAAAAAVVLGAQVVETHFTLDVGREGGDHSHSADPTMLAELVRRIRLIEKMRGKADTTETRSDRDFANLFRRGLHAAMNLPKGHILAPGDLTACRPAGIYGPNDQQMLFGKKLAVAMKAGDALTPNYL
ncbi:N-acetylneuraminate synthase family protein [Salidesulfovibrio onnuriiensis]|uniref:N-acetylneuraminate synthase family protein n=1 Tax=Salidesulfovibrio onnuriiensis TaxID=2583823 RepID=UPI0011C708A5|nr:N-acetylneuraminate synthase family protein [Salidesulfovibrio onnuriiensis]